MPVIASLLGYLVAAIAIGVPIAFALLFASIATGLYMGGGAGDPQIMAAQLLRGTDSVTMMALPFFILTGELMNRGGLTQRIIALASATVGRVRGGLGYVTILACLLFGSLVGSAIASTAALGALLIPMMVREGYNRERSAGLLASANLVAPIMPPSVPLIIYGAAAGVSIKSLFLAGVAPAVYLTLVMLVVWFFVSRSKEDIRSDIPRAGARGLMKLVLGAIWALLLPVIILVGLRGGVFTATEAGVVSVVYALLVGVFIYREIKIGDIFGALKSAAKMSAVVMFLAAAAQVAAYYMAISGIPALLTRSLGGLVENPTLLLLVLMLVVVVLGLVLDVVPTILIVTPLVLPLLQAAGINLIHFGIVFTLANVIGLLTPPVGPSLNVAAAVGKVKVGAIIRPVMPYLLAQTALVVVMVLVPDLVLVPLGWLEPPA
jgi:tripartite ATP-independent transporter DctM subunit